MLDKKYTCKLYRAMFSDMHRYPEIVIIITKSMANSVYIRGALNT